MKKRTEGFKLQLEILLKTVLKGVPEIVLKGVKLKSKNLSLNCSF